jgi:hypothetical protein
MIVGGSSTAQQALRECEAVFGSGVAAERPRLVRRFVAQWLEDRFYGDRPKRDSLMAAFERCYRAAQGSKRPAEKDTAWAKMPGNERPAAPVAPPEPCVGVVEAAEQLGMDERNLRARLWHGTVVSYKVGRARMIPVSEVERLVAAR